MSNSAAIIAKVQKLLALSKSCNIHEANAAAAKANQLIDQYRLSELDLEVSGTQESEPIEEDSESIYETGKVTAWKETLLGILVRHYGCAHYMSFSKGNTGRKVTNYKVIGRRSDIGIVRYMFTWLMSECTRLAEKEIKEPRKVIDLDSMEDDNTSEAMSRKVSGRVTINSFCMGFANGIGIQLAESRKQVGIEGNSTGLVKLNDRARESKEAMYAMIPRLRPHNGSRSSQIDSNAYGKGRTAGTNMHLGASMSTAGGTRLLGK